MPKLSVHQVKEKYQTKIMKIPGVVGIGVGKENDDDAIVVMVAELTPTVQKKVPDQLKGFPIVVQETGVISAL